MDSLDLKPTLGSMGSDKEPLVGLFICLLVRWVSILPSFSYHSLRAAHQAPGKGLSVREDVVGKTLGESVAPDVKYCQAWGLVGGVAFPGVCPSC